MATPIRIKRSAVPGKRPQVTDLQVGELALNTYDAELVTLRDRFSQTGIATEVVRVGAGATVTNIIYVTNDGNDNNTGLKLGDAKGSIAGAITTPLDVAKTRIMLADSGSELAKKQSASLAISIVFKENGLSGLFSGILPRVTWISVGGALFLGIYELSVSKLKQL